MKNQILLESFVPDFDMCHSKQKSDGIFPATGLESVNIFPSLVSQYPCFPPFFASDLCLPLNKEGKKRVLVYVISPLRYMRYVCVCVAFVVCVCV